MSTKYCRVNKAPTECKKNELIINLPDFKKEILKARRARGQQNVLTVNYLRGIFIEIGATYDPTFNAYADVNLSKYKGIPAANEDEVASCIFKIIEETRPELIEKAVTKDIMARPSRVQLIYFVAPDFNYTSAFHKNGIDSLLPDELDDFLGNKKTTKPNKSPKKDKK
jgi:hypothetical protein